MIMILYGICNCDMMKKVCVWFDVYGVVYDFYDYKMVGIDDVILCGWVEWVGWEMVLNCVGIMFCKLFEVDCVDLDVDRVVVLMLV